MISDFIYKQMNWTKQWKSKYG